MNTFGFIGISEILFVFIVAFIILGPEHMPQVARQLGKVVKEFRKGIDEFKHEFGKEMDEVKEATGIEHVYEEVAEIKDLSQKTLKDLIKNSESNNKSKE